MTPLTARDDYELTQERMRLTSSLRAPRTLLGYASDWRLFTAWCDRRGRCHLPASTETVALYVTDDLRGHKITTVTRHVSSIAHHHRAAELPSPCDTTIRQLLIGAQRITGEQPNQKAALSVEQMREICKHPVTNVLQASRDRALLMVGFATALRRSTLCSIDLADIEFVDRGFLVRIGKEKQDQSGKGRTIAVPSGMRETCPVKALRDWLAWRGAAPGALFFSMRMGRLHPNTVAQIVKRAVRRIGLDPLLYAGHSLRAGFVTAAVERQVNEFTIAATTGHRSLDTLRRYFRRSDPFRACACSALEL